MNKEKFLIKDKVSFKIISKKQKQEQNNNKKINNFQTQNENKKD